MLSKFYRVLGKREFAASFPAEAFKRSLFFCIFFPLGVMASSRFVVAEQIDVSKASNRLVAPHAALPTGREIIFRHRSPSESAILSASSGSSESVNQTVRKAISQNYGMSTVRPLYKGGETTFSQNIVRAMVPEGVSIASFIEQMNNDPEILWAQPNIYYETTIVPNDTVYQEGTQDYLKPLGLEAAWGFGTGSDQVVVAIIDTGVNYRHEDLDGNIWVNTGEIADDGVDNDGNGYIDDVIGWDFVSADADQVADGEDFGPQDNDPMDFDGHGTHVAGIAGAKGNNGIGVAGIAWNIRLMALRAGFASSAGEGILSAADIAEALYYACDNGADIVNMSFGSISPSAAIAEAIQYCVDRGVLLIAAAGNNGDSVAHYPAAYDGVVAVAALGSYSVREKTGFSNYGVWVDIAAPGQNIVSTLVDGSYGELSGTSMASPIVAGIAALYKSNQPGLTNAELVRSLYASASALTGHFAMGLGAGRVSASYVEQGQSLPEKISVVGVQEYEADVGEDGSVDEGETLELTLSFRNFSAPPGNYRVVAYSLDPGLSLDNGEFSLGYVGWDKITTPEDQAISMNISSPVSPNQNIEVRVELHGDSGFISAQTFTVQLNKTLKNLSYMHSEDSRYEFVNPEIYPHSDGSVSVLYSRNGVFSPPVRNKIYYRYRRSDREWVLPAEFPSMPDLSENYFSAVAAQNGVLHAVYLQYLEDSSARYFYARYDRDIDSWTSEAVTPALNSVFRLSSIALDSLQNPLICWTDEEGDSGVVYMRQKAGDEWLDAELAFDLAESEQSNIRDLACFVSSEGEPIVFWTDDFSLYFATRASDTWTTPVLIADSLDSGDYDIVQDERSAIHLLVTQGDNSFYHVYDQAEWRKVSTFSDRYPYQYKHIAINSEGHLELYIVTAGNQVYRRIFDGFFWNDAFLVGEYPELSAPHASVDLASDDELILVFAGDLADKVHSFSSKTDESVIPDRPVVTARFSSQNSVEAEFSSVFPDGISHYRIAMGSAPGLDDLVGWQTAPSGGSHTLPIEDYPGVKRGRQYFVSVRSTADNGYESQVGASNPIMLDGSFASLLTLRPESGSRYLTSEPITLSAEARDQVDGDISEQIQWSSSIDGFLGEGAAIEVRLSAGNHTISAQAVNSVAVATVDTVDISVLLDTDLDGIEDAIDTDDDNDGVADSDDAFPLDPAESADTDLDGVGNNADTDDDNDGVADVDDAFPLDVDETLDTDNDGIGNNADPDDDNDNVADTVDAFPLDPAESLDTDLDGVGNNADTDDDNDGIADVDDAFPLDGDEVTDTDNDGMGNNADPDDDNDNVADTVDAFPLDPAESLDTDLDGIGNNADSDDDNDNVADTEDAFPLDPDETLDTDFDGIGNNADADDDNDGVADGADAYPLDPSRSATQSSGGGGGGSTGTGAIAFLLMLLFLQRYFRRLA